MKLVIASGNPGKLREMKEMLADLPINVLSLKDYPQIGEIPETGSSFRENAALKAETVAKITGEWVLADDSGLEVDALGGRPGIYSARFAGEGAGDAANNAKLLQELKAIGGHNRKARFRAVIAIAHPGHETLFAEGECEGYITDKPQGSGGFGYDPLFYYPPAGLTFAQMTAEEKNKVSHRAKALAKAYNILKEISFREK